ncbi:MAG: hypothetical protein R3F34_10685 [Planctomycetota bacterium]
MTYPDSDTRKFLAENVVAHKVCVDDEERLVTRYDVAWTPGLVWTTPAGEAVHTNVGYFDPTEFQAECSFACGRVAAARGDWDRALERFDATAERWPHSHAAPAALFWAGAASKRSTGEVDGLLDRWKRILSDHAESAWAMKVSFVEED